MSLEQHEQDNDQNTFLTFTPTHRMKITRTRTCSLVKEIKYTHAWDTFNRKIQTLFRVTDSLLYACRPIVLMSVATSKGSF